MIQTKLIPFAGVGICLLLSIRHTTIPVAAISTSYNYFAPVIGYDTAFVDTIESPGQRLEYEFTGKENEVITIRSAKKSGYIRPEIVLRDFNGSVLKRHQSASSSRSARLDTLTLPMDGLYSISIGDVSSLETGGIGLSIQRIAPNNGSPTVGIESTSSLELAYPGQMRRVTFQGSAGDIITIRSNKKSGYVVPRIELYDPSGVLLQGIKAIASSWPARIDTFQLKSSGIYTVLTMDELGIETGAINLSIQRIFPPYQPARIPSDTNLVLELKEQSEMTGLTFSCAVDEVYAVRAKRITGYVVPVIEQYDTKGALQNSAQASSSSNPARIETFTVNDNGLNTILCFDRYGLETGMMGFSLHRIFPTPQILPLIHDTSIVLSLEVEGQMDLLTFYGRAQELVKITMVGTSGYVVPNMELYDSFGELIQSNKAISSSKPAYIELMLEEDGIYPLLVMDEYGSNTGSYSLSIQGIGTGVTNLIDLTICPSVDTLINGTLYNSRNLSGTETIVNGAAGGRDSIILVRLDTFVTASSIYSPTLCIGAKDTLHGQVFDQTNPKGTIVLENAGANGCDSLIYIMLRYDLGCSVGPPIGSVSLVIPKVFTPNGDGVNDHFVIPLLLDDPDRFPDSRLIVYNRYKRKVYESDHYYQDRIWWDGTDMYSGNPLPAGTYRYLFELGGAERIVRDGLITIIR